MRCVVNETVKDKCSTSSKIYNNEKEWDFKLKRGLRRGEKYLSDKHFPKEFLRSYAELSSAEKGIQQNPFVEFTSIHIHTANISTAKCVFCPYQQHVDPKSVMDLNLFKTIIDQYVRLGGDRVYFSPNAGDPLVDPSLTKKAAYARSVGVNYIGYFGGLD